MSSSSTSSRPCGRQDCQDAFEELEDNHKLDLLKIEQDILNTRRQAEQDLIEVRRQVRTMRAEISTLKGEEDDVKKEEDEDTILPAPAHVQEHSTDDTDYQEAFYANLAEQEEKEKAEKRKARRARAAAVAIRPGEEAASKPDSPPLPLWEPPMRKRKRGERTQRRNRYGH